MKLATKKIGGRVFAFSKIPVTKSMRIVVPIGRFLAGPLALAGQSMAAQRRALAAAGAPAEGGDGEKKPAPLTAAQEDARIKAVGEAIGALFEKLDPEQLVAVQVIVFESVSCDGKPIEGEDGIDETFSGGRLAEMLEVFWEALKENFGGFFPASLSASLNDLPSPFSQSSPPTSTG